MEQLPAYVSIVFILTTFAAIGFLLQAVKAVGLQKLASKLLLFLLPFWILLTAMLAMGGFFQNTATFPPRLVLFGVLPSLLAIAGAFVFFRRSFIEPLSLKLLTLLHIIRIPVEIVLYWLFLGGLVPEVMTFSGLNFDIVSGVFAPIAYFAAFRGATLRRWVLIGYNVVGIFLLANIVSIAVLSLPSPVQQMSFDQPNIAVLLFPYIWLPAIVVPIVLFSHLAALYKLSRRNTA